MSAATDVKCTCKTCTGICMTIDQIFRVLEIYGWILDCYIVDFFQDKLWDKLPQCWRKTLETVSPQEFGIWFSKGSTCNKVWPLSLLALRQLTDELQLNRDNTGISGIRCCKSFEQFKTTNENIFHPNENKKLALNVQLDKSFSNHVKEKKRYEIKQIAELCARCAYETNCECVVDVGAGKGHLARVLGFQYGLCVTCIEQDPLLSQRAKQCDEELMISLTKRVPELSKKYPQHISTKIEASNYSNFQLSNTLCNVFKNNFPLNIDKSGFGLIGLHPCGDLAATLLKFYSTSQEAKFICIVGCCYMKMTLECDQSIGKNYPLSTYLSESKNNIFSYAALEVACHAIEKHYDQLRSGSYNDLTNICFQVHAYRAALETILIKKNHRLRRTCLKNIKVKENMTFQQYCTLSTVNLNLELQPKQSEMEDPEIKSYLSRWRQVILFGSLRIMLAPLIETVLLLDRFLFLSDNNFAPILKAVFDARLSPRNFVLISMKK